MKWLPVSMCLGKESSVRSNSPPVETLASGFSGDCKDEAIYIVLSLTFTVLSVFMDFVKIRVLMLHLCLIDFEESPTPHIYFAKITIVALHC